MINYRTITVSDIPLIQYLARDIWTSVYPGIISMNQIDYMLNIMYNQEKITNELHTGFIWQIIEPEFTPAGYLAMEINAPSELKLHKLYLKKITHGKGYGRQTLEHVAQIASNLGVNNITLTVNKKNELAIKVYSKFGFACIGSVVNDIGEGYVMDDFIFCYKL